MVSMFLMLLFTKDVILKRAIDGISNEFQLNCKEIFDKSQCAVCSGFGQTFFVCHALKDDDQIKQAYIYSRVAVSCFFNSVKKVGRDSHVSFLTASSFHYLEHISFLQQPFSLMFHKQILHTMSLQHPLFLPLLVSPDADSLMVSTLCGIKQQLQNQSQQLQNQQQHISALLSFISNISTM